LEVLLTPERGFCLGVKKAVELAERVAGEVRGSGRGVWTLGPLIHNRRVIQALEALGVRIVRNVEEILPGDVLVLPSHGTRPDVVAAATARGLRVEDATCPLVRKVQAAAKALLADGYQVVVVGQPHHVEVVAVVGWAGGRAVVVEDAEQAASLPLAGRVAVVSQTTQRPEKVAAVVDTLRGRGAEVRVEPTLCHVTSERQRKTRELVSKIDVLLVVGGRESANTQKLAEVGREMGRRVYHIEAAHEVEPSWFGKDDRVGIAAGTSTPDWITEEVVVRMKDIEPDITAKQEEIEAKAPDAGQPEAPAAAADGEPGARVTGTVVKVGDSDALIDIGAKSEAILPLSEMSRRRLAGPDEAVKVGETVEAVVIRVDDEGRPVLSRKRVEEDNAWLALEAAHASNATIEAPVTALVKGGLVADVGTRGFIPASQVGLEFIQDLAPYVGKTLQVKVLEIDRGERRVILSEKKVLEQERGQAKTGLLDGVHEGETRTGEVRRVTDYGAFVDIGGVDGLVHVSEMSWKRVADPREVVKEGDKVEVRVLKVDHERGRISLGMKQVKGDPWASVVEQFPVGTVIKGRAVSVADFGVFVELAEGIEGLVHVSQLSDKRISKPSDVVRVGDELRVKVLKVSPAERRISLSAREGEEEMDRRDIKKFLKSANETAAVTIGDLVGDVFKGTDLGDEKDAKPKKRRKKE
jgi:small subunit ribosomal protein S1